MLKSIRILLAIVSHCDYEIGQMDVKTTFHKGNLSKDVCMTQLEVFTPRNGNKVCKLQRSNYGLKQASRSWNIRFNVTIKEFDFSKNVDEACVYKKFIGSEVLFLVLYVDDILIIGNDVLKIQYVNIYLLSRNFLRERPWRSNLIIGDIDL